jgi:hypothetical protein
MEEDLKDKKRRWDEDEERGTWGLKKRRGMEETGLSRGLKALHTEVEEHHLVMLEMMAIQWLEVQDKKLEKWMEKLAGEAQMLRSWGDRIITLLQKEELSMIEE